ncbi:MAG: ferredoxin--NADP reductase [Bacteroidota bacterium]
MPNFYTLKIYQIRPLTPSSVAITFEIPEELYETFDFIPGQYITIKKKVNGQELRRAYSISSLPKTNRITIGVKKVDQGGFSHFANTQLAVGDSLEVMPPEGRFVFNPSETPKKIAAFAAGSGITPIMSIVRSVLESHPQNEFVLVYGNRSYEEAMFHEELKQLHSNYTNRFSIYFINSRAHEKDALFGRIDASTVNYVLKNKHKDTLFDAHYLCGPEAMINLVTDTLTGNAISKDRIFFELFIPTETPKILSETPEGQTQLTVVLDDEEFILDMDRKTRVLDAVLNENIDAPYSCQGGVCSSCIARIKEGKADMVQNQILTDGEIEEGFVLTCQALPLTPTLTVDYDDV